MWEIAFAVGMEGEMAPNGHRCGWSGGSLFLGLALSTAFLGALSTPWLSGTSLYRYCMSHDVEKVAVVMFFWGLADLLLKARRFRAEKAALRREWLGTCGELVPASTACNLLTQIDSAPKRLHDSWIADRLRAALTFATKRGTADGLDDHLRQLGDTAADRSHGSFALVRIIAWMIPILGFLGTVVGITIAVANVSPNQLDSSLSEVTSGLAMAFDATAVALALAMLLMFAYYLTERTESRLLQAVDDAAAELLLHRFQRNDDGDSPLFASMEKATVELKRHAATLIDAQANLWADALSKTAEQTNALLARHHQELEFALQSTRTESDRQIESMHQATEHLQSVERALGANARLLAALVDQGAALAPMQSALADNLTLLRQSQGLDDALHSLTAAIHLMTARARSTGFEKAA